MDHGIASDFLIHRAGRYLPEVGSPSKEMVQQVKELYEAYGGRLPSPSRPAPLSPSKQLEAFTKEFESGITDFFRRSEDQEALRAFKNGSSWDKLQGEAQKAWTAYDNHKARKLNWRRPFEVLDNAAEKVMTNYCIEFLLELIPDGEYSSLLSGGLTLAYNTAVRKEKFRGEILGLFDSLSERAEQTKANIRLYSNNPHLHNKSEELYMAVIDCVRHSIAWLDKSSAMESFKAFFQQSKYGSKWEDAKANLDKKVKEFEEAVNMCMKQVIGQTHELTTALYFLFTGFLKDLPARLEVLRAQAANTPSNIIYHTTNDIHNYHLIPVLPSPMVISAWNLANSCLAIDYHNRHISPGQQPFPTNAITHALWDLNSDINTAIHHIPSQMEREKMGYLALTPRFTNWLRSMDSQFLILHEHTSTLPMNSSLSTLSHLCAMISSTLCPNINDPPNGLWTLPFFCGLHTSANSTFQGGLGLIRALTLQLISTLNQSLTLPIPPTSTIPDTTSLAISLLSDSTPNDGSGSQALQTTCLIFSHVLSQIQTGMIFILIDGAHWNETRARKNDMAAVMRYFYDLVGELRVVRRGLVLKVLVTNPAMWQRVDWGFPGAEVVMGDCARGLGLGLGGLDGGIETEMEMEMEVETDLYMERVVVGGGFEGMVGEVVRDAVGGEY